MTLVLSLILLSYFIVYENFSRYFYEFNNKINKFKEDSKKILVVEHIQFLRNNSLIILIRNISNLNITLEKLEFIDDQYIGESQLGIVLKPNSFHLIKLKQVSTEIDEIILYYSIGDFKAKLIIYRNEM